MTAYKPLEITDDQKRQYRDEGYFILDRCLSDDQLELLRSHCQELMDGLDAEMDAKGVANDGINVRGNRYFIIQPAEKCPDLLRFLTSDLMLDICRATLGDNADMVWEQYVVKAADSGKSFGWHQDSGYAEYGDAEFWPGVSCWCPLDDVDESNGTVYILPYAKAGGNKVVHHVRDEELNDLVGYFGSEPGVPVIIPAGGIAVFSHLAFHRSGANTTSRMRRVYLSQYAVASMRNKVTGESIGPAMPVLRNGRRVANETRCTAA